MISRVHGVDPLVATAARPHSSALPHPVVPVVPVLARKVARTTSEQAAQPWLERRMTRTPAPLAPRCARGTPTTTTRRPAQVLAQVATVQKVSSGPGLACTPASRVAMAVWASFLQLRVRSSAPRSGHGRWVATPATQGLLWAVAAVPRVSGTRTPTCSIAALVPRCTVTPTLRPAPAPRSARTTTAARMLSVATGSSAAWTQTWSSQTVPARVRPRRLEVLARAAAVVQGSFLAPRIFRPMAQGATAVRSSSAISLARFPSVVLQAAPPQRATARASTS
uniref:Unannotated protein n=1 Tax=freshwater metagenome TaxID=449393 RepID=A0A6J7P4Q2_9ZZZZ